MGRKHNKDLALYNLYLLLFTAVYIMLQSPPSFILDFVAGNTAYIKQCLLLYYHPALGHVV